MLTVNSWVLTLAVDYPQRLLRCGICRLPINSGRHRVAALPWFAAKCVQDRQTAVSLLVLSWRVPDADGPCAS